MSGPETENSRLLLVALACLAAVMPACSHTPKDSALEQHLQAGFQAWNGRYGANDIVDGQRFPYGGVRESELWSSVLVVATQCGIVIDVRPEKIVVVAIPRLVGHRRIHIPVMIRVGTESGGGVALFQSTIIGLLKDKDGSGSLAYKEMDDPEMRSKVYDELDKMIRTQAFSAGKWNFIR